MMSILDRYFGRIILQYTLITMLGLLALFAFVSFLDQLEDLGKGEYGVREALAYILLTMPRTMYELFPIAALLGCGIGLSLLANDSELIAMRASGVSVLQITTAALKTGGLFVVAAMLIGELISPQSEDRAQRGRAEALQQTDSGLWLRDAQTYFHADEVLPDLTLRRIRIFEFDSQRRLRELVSATHGRFADGHWLLDNVAKTRIDADGNAETARLAASRWQSGITPEILSVFLLQPDQLSLRHLRRYIGHLRANRQQTESFELAFWNKMMLPISTAIMVALAIPFVFVNIRSGTLGRNLFIGIMLGLGFHVANRGLGYIVLAYGLPPVLGATLPLLAFVLLAAAMLWKVEHALAVGKGR